MLLFQNEFFYDAPKANKRRDTNNLTICKKLLVIINPGGIRNHSYTLASHILRLTFITSTYHFHVGLILLLAQVRTEIKSLTEIELFIAPDTHPYQSGHQTNHRNEERTPRTYELLKA